MKSSLTVLYLVIAGLLLLVIGGALVVVPHSFHGSNGIALGHDPNLLSEIRAPGGLLANSGIIILIGAMRRQLRSLAVRLTTLVYGSFGLARIVSIALDGMPSSSIVAATVLELVVAFVGLTILWRRRAEVTCVSDRHPAGAAATR